MGWWRHVGLVVLCAVATFALVRLHRDRWSSEAAVRAYDVAVAPYAGGWLILLVWSGVRAVRGGPGDPVAGWLVFVVIAGMWTAVAVAAVLRRRAAR